jgi:hypothetical protein
MVELYEGGDYPKDVQSNLRWRRELRVAASGDVKFQRVLIERCRVDILFFFNAFVFLFEPRSKKVDGKQAPTQIPFTTWCHQDVNVLKIVRAIEDQRDVGVEKSRGEGATWMMLMIFLWFWLFNKQFMSFGIVSRNEQASDNPEDPDSLGWKLDFALSNLPRWMVHNEKGEKSQPSPSTKFHRSVRNHTWANRVTNSTITAYTTTGDLGRGGRKTAFALDEMASYRPGDDEAVMSSMVEVTDCVIMVSTPKGPRGAYYKAMKESGPLLEKIRIHWTENDSRNRGLYTLVDGKPVAVDPVNNPLPEGYAKLWLESYRSVLLDRGFHLDDGERSPWYDGRCLRPRMTPKFIAQEYDIDYGGSSSRFFPIAMLERLQEQATPPVIVGEIDFNQEDLLPKWRPAESGHLQLWFELTAADSPPQGVRYIVGADISTGQAGAEGSNSALSIVERDTGVKVGEFAHAGQPPELFAMQSVAISKWFNNAYLIWEANGPGKTFTSAIRDIGYENIYLRTVLTKVNKEKTKMPGFWSQKDSKRELLSNYAFALGSSSFVNPSYLALEEAKGYEEFASGKIEHTAALEADPSGAGENHGDRAIADALANHALMENPLSKRKVSKQDISKAPEHSAAGRRHRYLEEVKSQRQDLWSSRAGSSVSARLKRFGFK